ncbi:DUF4250 domain-containing protein [Thalassotalea sp. M1531]|uniref:DUF4250 domain-containing protein n=1 Tax=Thalassotalea algicola TaxID=2716224 RepID=A0A7Y0LEJ0_9GAMM|nr:DUF4250 domain-containing protein [Thalassotalea algicola]NMP32727.1 DUF4250 domain-containing protein [Thalassotalea algicola]
MDLTKCMNMDANILLGIANDKLRHECRSLHSLAAMMDVNERQLESRLAEIGFHYEEDLNQFRPDIK